jgi:class 3 adenylate cyclase
VAAREASSSGDWEGAYSLLAAADRAEGLSPEGLQLLADAAYWAGHPETSVEAWQRMHDVLRAAGDRDGAAFAAVRVVSLLYDIGSHSRFMGWLRRAERLIEGRPDGPASVFVHIFRTLDATFSGNVEEGLHHAQRANEIAERLGDPGFQLMAMHARARPLILRGDVEEGVALMEEAAAGIPGSGLDPIIAGYLYCNVVCAWQNLADYRRAEDWTAEMERWCERNAIGGVPGLCSVHRAEVKRLRGAFTEAEAEARRGYRELETYLPSEIPWALSELALIRLRRGDLSGAEEAIREAHERGRPAQPAQALLLLARGEPRGAAASINDSMENPVPIRTRESPPNTDYWRSRLLPVQVEANVAAGNLERARRAADELERVAGVLGTDAPAAAATTARASVLLAEGDAPGARQQFLEAVARWGELGTPYELARARIGLAGAYRAEGNEDRAAEELRAARTTFERLGAVPDARSAAAALGEAVEVPAGIRTTRTFVFTDIVGSTQLAETLGDEAWGHVLRWHNEKIAALAAAHGGEVVHGTGDGFLLSFGEPDRALEFAVATHRAFDEHRRTAGFAPHLRIGAHQAEATREGGDYRGVGVHAAARISALAGSEEITTSRETAEAAGEGFRASDPRAESLKGIAEPVEVVTISWRP